MTRLFWITMFVLNSGGFVHLGTAWTFFTTILAAWCLADDITREPAA